MSTMNYKEYQDPLYKRFQKITNDYNELNQYRSMFDFKILPINKRFRYIHNVNTWEQFDAFFLEELNEINESIRLLVEKEESDKSVKIKESDISFSELRTFLQKKQNIQRYCDEANITFELITSIKDYYIKCYEYLKQNKMNDDFEMGEKWASKSKYGKLKLIDIPHMITKYEITEESEYIDIKKKIRSMQIHLNEIHKEMESIINTCHMEHIERIKRNMFKYFKSANCPYKACMEKINSYTDCCPHCNQMILLKFNEDISINDTPTTVIYYFKIQE